MLDIDVTRNGNNLKLKVKSEFSLSMGLMVINHSNPYIHSTTVLCDRRWGWFTVAQRAGVIRGCGCMIGGCIIMVYESVGVHE